MKCHKSVLKHLEFEWSSLKCLNQSCDVLSGQKKKNCLVSENWLGENFFNHSPVPIVECISEYVFLVF